MGENCLGIVMNSLNTMNRFAVICSKRMKKYAAANWQCAYGCCGGRGCARAGRRG